MGNFSQACGRFRAVSTVGCRNVKKDIYESFSDESTLKACGLAGCEALERYWTEAVYPARSLIVSEDEDDDDVYFILSGRARAATYTASGREVMLSDLERGDSFGIFAAIDGQPRSTNVVALEKCRIARMTAAHFNEALETNRDVVRAYLRYLVDRIRALSAKMTDVTTLNAEQRLITELIRLSRPLDGNEDMAAIDPLPTQQQLATVIFSQREAVGRDMSKLTQAGLLKREGRALTIKSLRRLEARLET